MSYCSVQTFHFLSLFPSPRALFPGLGSEAPTSKAREKHLGDKVDFSHSMQYGIMIDKIQTKSTRVFRLSPLAWIE